jgi:DNA-packaging protein gp3
VRFLALEVTQMSVDKESLWQKNKGNKFKKERTFKNSEDMWKKACVYFKWVEDNPIIERKAFNNGGAPIIAEIPRMRAMTIAGFCLHTGIREQTWDNYRKIRYEEYGEAIDRILMVMYEQKFTGAAAEQLSPNIIARDLALVDKIDNTLRGPNGGPIKTQQIIFEGVGPDDASAAD